MADLSEIKVSQANIGLELDRMEIPTISPKKSVEVGGYRGVQQRSDSGRPSRIHSILKLFVLLLGVLLPFVLTFFLWNQGIIDLPFLKSNRAQKELKRYATVGPVMTSIGENQHVKLTIQIECKNSRLKEKMVGISSAVKNKLMVVLNSPETKEKLLKQDYSSLKSDFKKEIESLMPPESVKAVYFSNILLY